MNEEEDLMGMFSQGAELNFDQNYFDDESNEDDIVDEQELPDTSKNNNPVEDEDPENVDGEETDNNEGNDSDSDDSSPNLYSSISNVLFEQGIIPSLESADKVKTADDFVDVFKKEIEVQSARKLEEYLSNLDLEKIATSKKAQFDLDAIDEDYLRNNLEVAKDIIYRDALNQGLSEERARKFLRKSVDLGEDMIIEDALESKVSLKDFENRQIEQEKTRYQQTLAEQAKEQEQINTTIRNTIYNSKEVITGIPNTKALQERVYKSMTEVVAKDPTTGEMQNKFMQARSQNPIDFDTKMYYLYELTNGFTDLKNISKTTTTNAVKALESVLRKTKFEDNGVPGYIQDPQSYGGIGFGSELVL